MLYTDQLGPLLARAEGCPRALAVDALRDTCIEFCKESRWLTTGSQVVIDGTQVPNLGMDVQVVDICEARVGDDPVFITYLNDPDAEPDALAECGEYDYALRFADPNNPILTPATGVAAPSVAAPVTLDLVLVIAPGPESTEISLDLWRRFSEGLKSGAIARLLTEPNKPWTVSGDAVRRFASKYASDLATATAEASRNRAQPGRRLRSKPA